MNDIPGGTQSVNEQAPVPKRRPRVLPWVLAAAGVVILGAAIIIPVSISSAERAAEERAEAQAAAAEKERLGTFVKVVQTCEIRNENVRVLDGGESLDLARVTKANGPTYADMSCVLSELDAPSAIEAAIGQTRALDGRQKDDWTGYEIAWTYHPDDGASILIEHAR